MSAAAAQPPLPHMQSGGAGDFRTADRPEETARGAGGAGDPTSGGRAEAGNVGLPGAGPAASRGYLGLKCRPDARGGRVHKQEAT